MAASDPDAVFVADYSRYTPLKGAPAAFVATPIFDGPSQVGTFVLQISTAEIDRVVSGNRAWRGTDQAKQATSRSSAPVT